MKKKIEELQAELADQARLLKTLQTQCDLLTDLVGDQFDAGNLVSVANPPVGFCHSRHASF
eukprot:196664-Karenia_brevis.AAC.1